MAQLFIFKLTYKFNNMSNFAIHRYSAIYPRENQVEYLYAVLSNLVITNNTFSEAFLYYYPYGGGPQQFVEVTNATILNNFVGKESDVNKTLLTNLMFFNVNWLYLTNISIYREKKYYTNNLFVYFMF